MATPEQIKEKLREIIGLNPNLPIPCTVVSIEGESCTVRLPGNSGLEVDSVRLMATNHGQSNYFKITPSLNSKVLVESLTGKVDNLAVIKVDQVEKIEFKQNALEVVADGGDGKVSIKSGQESLHKIWTDMLQMVRELTVSTPAGPSGTPLPPTILTLSELELRINQVLK